MQTALLVKFSIYFVLLSFMVNEDV